MGNHILVYFWAFVEWCIPHLEFGVYCFFALIKLYLSVCFRDNRVVPKDYKVGRLFKNWFIFSMPISSYGCSGKFGEHERSIRVARGDSREQL